MTSRELIDLILAGRESRNLEYKQSIAWNNPKVKAKITKSILAMSNTRDGGAIVIGEEQQSDGTFKPIGMNQIHVDTFNYDDVASHVAEYADPYSNFSLTPVEYEGNKFVVIQVEEFEEIPVICRRSYGKILHRGRIYVRTRRMPESANVSSQTEMREIIGLAIDKGIRRFYQRLSGLGLTATSLPISKDEELFEQEIEGIR